MKKKIHRLWRRTGRSAFLVILSCLFVVVPLPANALDVYVSNFDDGTIRKIDSTTGSVTVVASELPSPEGIAIDSNGIMYIGGVYSVGVRRIRIADGVRLPDVGTNICGPEGPSIDSQGNVYFNTRSEEHTSELQSR